MQCLPVAHTPAPARPPRPRVGDGSGARGHPRHAGNAPVVREPALNQRVGIALLELAYEQRPVGRARRVEAHLAVRPRPPREQRPAAGHAARARVHEQRREHVALDALCEEVVDARRNIGDLAREGDGHHLMMMREGSPAPRPQRARGRSRSRRLEAPARSGG